MSNHKRKRPTAKRIRAGSQREKVMRRKKSNADFWGHKRPDDWEIVEGENSTSNSVPTQFITVRHK